MGMICKINGLINNLEKPVFDLYKSNPKSLLGIYFFLFIVISI
jgi:hypothetical protein